MTTKMGRGYSYIASYIVGFFLQVKLVGKIYSLICMCRCLDELEDTKKALETAHMICSKATVSHTELQVEIPTLFQCIK